MYKKLLLFIPQIGGGGVEKNFFIIANYLAKKVDKITVITINKEYEKRLDKKIKIIAPKKGKWKNSSIYIKYIVSIIFLIKTLLSDKNYLIFSFQANWYAIIITKLFGLKIISRSNTAPQGWSNNIIKKTLYRFIINLADEVIVNSYEFKRSLKNFFDVKSICIYNPLNKSKILKLSKMKKKNIFFKDKKYLKILNIGRFTDQKNQIIILKSIKHLNNLIPIRLIIAGRGKNYRYLKNFISENKLNKNVLLLNFLNNPYNYIKNSDIFVLSSNYEGLPNVLLEAQCLKKIIISTKCPTGPQEILLNGRAGIFFKINDYKDLSKKIIYVYKNRYKLKDKVKIGYDNLYRFDEKKNLNRYYQIIFKHLKNEKN
tara:strand:- start:237 stop:1349 length:1113 start_codon:yes stop_codon:yes gene_type:complete